MKKLLLVAVAVMMTSPAMADGLTDGELALFNHCMNFVDYWHNTYPDHYGTDWYSEQTDKCLSDAKNHGSPPPLTNGPLFSPGQPPPPVPLSNTRPWETYGEAPVPHTPHAPPTFPHKQVAPTLGPWVIPVPPPYSYPGAGKHPHALVGPRRAW
jgi:hypothetical protein